MMIWEYHFLRQFVRVFFLFLSCFYGLYILIDYASRASTLSFHYLHLSWYETVRYYLFVFASRAELLLPVALLIAFVHTVCMLNSRGELTALRAAGFSLQYLMRPFLIMGLFCTILVYANEQFFLPHALRKLRQIEGGSKHQHKHLEEPFIAHHLFLRDGSLLIFQSYDSTQASFFDVYWVQSVDSIYRVKSLSLAGSTPVGYFVDHLMRQPNGELLQEEAYRKFDFPEMLLDVEEWQPSTLEPEVFSLLELAREMPNITASQLNDKDSKMLVAFYWKLIIPWLCLLAIMAPAPFCVLFSRQMPLFLLYACSLFALIAFYMAMDALQIIAKRQLVAPVWAICYPFSMVFGCCVWRFRRMA